MQDSYLDAILNKNAILCTLEISVRCGDIGRVIGRTRVSDVLRKPAEPVRSWFVQDWMRDALDEVQEEIASMLLALQTFRPELPVTSDSQENGVVSLRYFLVIHSEEMQTY
ncbi:hypothetical protein [Ewingella americana]|uniref:hypothetical protein n=1 Tax=Ewingella americana TaxID=41202 RepID=UPI0012ADEF50|nr:hypothetical protein [Ewingella americana]MRT06073.1 hypothetical protein [Ewingella americana]